MNPIKQAKVDLLTYKIYANRAEMGAGAAREVADRIRQLLEQKEYINMIFAAAPSQNELLAGLLTEKGIDFSRINAFHMDEYIGLPTGAPQAFSNFLKNALFDKVSFRSVNLIDPTASDFEAEAERYAELLREYPCDIVCMGIGENGHIAFNDPHVAFFDDPLLVKRVSLDSVCRMQQVNDGAFAAVEEVPEYALTLTIPALMSADHVFCVVPAASKAAAVKATVLGEITEECPASILRTHKSAVLYTDTDSGSLIL